MRRRSLLVAGLLFLATAAAATGAAWAASDANLGRRGAHVASPDVTELVALLSAEGLTVRRVISDDGLLHQVAGGAHASVLILEPPAPAAAHVERDLRRLLLEGSTIVLADPEGQFNPWLAEYGASVAGERLLTGGSPTPDLLELGPVEGGGPVLARLPHTLILRDAEGWSPRLWSPEGSALDIDGDGAVGVTDPPGPHLVAASRPVGKGALVVVADASLFLAPQLAQGGTGRFVADAFAADGQAIVHVLDPAPAQFASQVATGIEALGAIQEIPERSRWLMAAAVAALALLASQRSQPPAPFSPHTTTVPEIHPDHHRPQARKNGGRP